MENNMLKPLKNIKGFTILELLIAAAVGCGIILFTAQFIKKSGDINEKVQNDLEETSNNLNLESILRKDLTNNKHSLNNLNTKDDQNNNFFDYLSSTNCTSNCLRSVKFELSAVPDEISKKVLYFIIVNQNAGEQQIYNPADAYGRGSLVFNSLNYNDTLSARQNSLWSDSVKQKSSLIFLYSPMEVFSPVSGVLAPGRMLSYMGWVGASNFSGTLNREIINDGIYDNDDLRTGKKITSEDAFFKNMPYTVGLGSFAFVTAVKVIRYRFKTILVNGKISGQLLRGEMNSDKIFNEKPIGFNLKSIEFSRQTISSPAIYIKMENII